MAATTVVLKNHLWDLHKGSYEEMDELPMMSNPGTPFMILILYLVFVLKVGPNFMRKREAFNLAGFMIFYNAFQVALSVYLVYNTAMTISMIGLVPKQCSMSNDITRKKIVFCYWLYFVAKVTELADTVIFVLRKKDNQVSFLHVYHHSIMMIGTWFVGKYMPSDSLVYGGCINSLVHVFMYSYYGLSAFGPSMSKYLTWKKHMTKFQLVQFVSIIFQFIATMRSSECPPSRALSLFTVFNVVLFLALFLNFYKKSYYKKSRKNSITPSNNISNGKTNSDSLMEYSNISSVGRITLPAKSQG